MWTGWGQVKWVVQKCGLNEDRSIRLCRNVDWLRTGQVGCVKMCTEWGQVSWVVQQKALDFVIRWATLSLSRNTVLYGFKHIFSLLRSLASISIALLCSDPISVSLSYMNTVNTCEALLCVQSIFVPFLSENSKQIQIRSTKFITLRFSPATINASFNPVTKCTAIVAQSSE